jgi:ABC-type uncharacterized transport system auxiliary subunit
MIRLAIIAVMLSGCATLQQQAAVTDTFCLQKERKWDHPDSAETVHEIRVFNETLRRRCSRMKLS